MDYLSHILEAVGVGAAAGLSPLVAVAAVVISAAVQLGIDTGHSDVNFVAQVAVVAVAGVVLVQSFLMLIAPGGVKLRIAADRPRALPLHLPLAVLAGGLGGAIVFNAERDSTVVGALVAAVSAALVAFAASGLLAGVVRRLDVHREQAAAKAKAKADDEHAEGEPADDEPEAEADDDARTTGRVLAAGVDIVAIAAVALALLAPPVGLVLPVLAILLLLGGRRRGAKKHEGLRSLR